MHGLGNRNRLSVLLLRMCKENWIATSENEASQLD